MLVRKVENTLIEKLTNYDRIVMVEGARQIGKTYIIRYVGKKLFKNFIEINLLDDLNGEKIFENVTTVDKFYMQVSAMYGNLLDKKENTLIFLDEIQAYPHLITMLKFLKDDDKYTYITSGSLLGVTLNECVSVPMGYVSTVKMYPLDFEEFLLANGVKDNVISDMKNKYENNEAIDIGLHKIIMNYFKKYLIVGGLPQAVNTFLINGNVSKVRDVQREIQNYYKIDASQYDLENKLKIRRIYDLIPSYLENKKKRVVIKDIDDKKKRTSDYKEEFDYLINSGISLEVKAISNPVYPIITSINSNLLKLYYNDVGLITYTYFEKNINAIMNDNLSVNLGNVYETVVVTELKSHIGNLFYYDNRVKGEVDFLVNDYKNLSVLPIEVKSGKDYKVHNSLSKFMINYNIKKGIVLSNEREVMIENNVVYMPIYYAMFINNENEDVKL